MLEWSLFLPFYSQVEGHFSLLGELAAYQLEIIVANGARSGPNRSNRWACCSRAFMKRYAQLPLAFVELSTALNVAVRPFLVSFWILRPGLTPVVG